MSIEYALIRDINDQAWRADLLGRAAQGAPRARQPDPAQPHAGVEVDRVAAGATSVSSSAACRRTGSPDRPGHPGPGDRRRLRSARRNGRRPGRGGAALVAALRTGRAAGKGYQPRQVDAFVAQVEAALKGPDAGLATPAKIRRAGFDLVRNGYQMAAVDAHLDLLERRALDAEAVGPGSRRRTRQRLRCERAAALCARPRGDRVDRAPRLRRGYHRREVDDFLDRIALALEGRAALGVDEVRAWCSMLDVGVTARTRSTTCSTTWSRSCSAKASSAPALDFDPFGRRTSAIKAVQPCCRSPQPVVVRHLEGGYDDPREMYDAAYRQSIEDPEGFWARAPGRSTGSSAPRRVLDDSRPPFYRWFPDGG